VLRITLLGNLVGAILAAAIIVAVFWAVGV